MRRYGSTARDDIDFQETKGEKCGEGREESACGRERRKIPKSEGKNRLTKNEESVE